MVEVTQEDRELLIELISFDSETIDAILAGSAFTWEVEQIARHRIAAMEEAATELDRQDGYGEWSEAAAAIRALRTRIAEDQAQIAALTTYRENLRDEVIELRARIAELEAFQQQAIKQVCELAREAGEAKGKLEASELPGIVDGWREKCERLDRRVAELEACIDLVIPDDCKSQLHEDATNMVKLQARVAELEAERAEWVEVERLRIGKATPPTPPV